MPILKSNYPLMAGSTNHINVKAIVVPVRSPAIDLMSQIQVHMMQAAILSGKNNIARMGRKKTEFCLLLAICAGISLNLAGMLTT